MDKTTKERKPRRVFTPKQLEELKSVFERNKYPNSSQRFDLAYRLGLEVQEVQVWFKNRRAKLARERRRNGDQDPQDQWVSDNFPQAPVPCDLPGPPGSCQLPPISFYGIFSSVEPRGFSQNQAWRTHAQNALTTHPLDPSTNQLDPSTAQLLSPSVSSLGPPSSLPPPAPSFYPPAGSFNSPAPSGYQHQPAPGTHLAHTSLQTLHLTSASYSIPYPPAEGPLSCTSSKGYLSNSSLLN